MSPNQTVLECETVVADDPEANSTEYFALPGQKAEFLQWLPPALHPIQEVFEGDEFNALALSFGTSRMRVSQAAG